MQRGFSLIELSIVLVILGLLTGGILTGQSLIRASELRAVTTEYERYVAATHTFRDKYFAIPGDMMNATTFWGTDTNCGGTYAGTTPAAGTCDGNGNGILNVGAANQTSEAMQFWKQLAFAGLIEGSYTGFTGPANGYDGLIQVNVPASKLNSAGWGAQSEPNNTGSTILLAYDYGNTFFFGARLTGAVPQAAAIKPEEAWNIDTKLDDGKPTIGKIIATNWAGCTTSTSQTDTTGAYKLTDGSIQCGLAFAKSY